MEPLEVTTPCRVCELTQIDGEICPLASVSAAMPRIPASDRMVLREDNRDRGESPPSMGQKLVIEIADPPCWSGHATLPCIPCVRGTNREV
jgi:hypothetical protein